MCYHPWTWLGLDLNLPIFFDLDMKSLESQSTDRPPPTLLNTHK